MLEGGGGGGGGGGAGADGGSLVVLGRGGGGEDGGGGGLLVVWGGAEDGSASCVLAGGNVGVLWVFGEGEVVEDGVTLELCCEGVPVDDTVFEGELVEGGEEEAAGDVAEGSTGIADAAFARGVASSGLSLHCLVMTLPEAMSVTVTFMTLPQGSSPIDRPVQPHLFEHCVTHDAFPWSLRAQAGPARTAGASPMIRASTSTGRATNRAIVFSRTL